jgi:hypothetical protein
VAKKTNNFKKFGKLASLVKKIADRKPLNTDDAFAKPKPVNNPAGREKR